jgi:hypothetical protein
MMHLPIPKKTRGALITAGLEPAILALSRPRFNHLSHAMASALNNTREMEQSRIELLYLACKASVLPLNYSPKLKNPNSHVDT